MYSVFISRKSEDAHIGHQLRRFLQTHNISAFDSDISLHEMGRSEYQDAIDEAIEKADHMVLIATDLSYITSKWVKSEWRSFENESRSNRKKGNLILLLSKQISVADLPLALRQKQIFKTEDQAYQQMLPYLVAKPDSTPITAEVVPPVPTKPVNKAINNKLNPKINFNWVYVLLPIIVFLLGWIYYPESTKIANDSSQSQQLDSMFLVVKDQFINQGLDKNETLKIFKKMTLQNPAFGYKGAEVFQQKAIETPVLKEKYLELSQELINYADSLRKD